FEDGDNTWLSKRYRATFAYDDNMQVRKFYSSLYPLSKSVINWRMSAYYFYKKDKELFISTDSGLVIYNTINETARLYNPPPPSREGDFRTIIPLDSNQLLIRSVSQGLFIFNTAEKKFTKHLTEQDSCPVRLNYLLRTSKNEILLAADQGYCLVKYSYPQN